MMSQINIKEDNFILEVCLNRPDVRNAFHPEMIKELTEVFSNIPENIRAVVLRGEGKSFCAGADLGWMKSMANFSFEENVKDSEELYNMFAAVRNCVVPVITYVHGHVMGGALGLVAASDIVIAEEKTKFCFSEVRLGIAPAVISPFVAAKAVSSFVHRYCLSGELFNSYDAHKSGLVHEVITEEEIESGLKLITEAFVNNGPKAVRETKSLLLSILPSVENHKTKTTELIAKLRVSNEGQEGLNSFFNKSRPQWIPEGES